MLHGDCHKPGTHRTEALNRAGKKDGSSISTISPGIQKGTCRKVDTFLGTGNEHDLGRMAETGALLHV